MRRLVFLVFTLSTAACVAAPVRSDRELLPPDMVPSSVAPATQGPVESATGSPPAVPPPAASPSQTETPAVAPTGTPASTPPATLRRSAMTDQDGVRVRVVLDRNPMPAGEENWATIEVTNNGSDTLRFLRDGCAIVASLWGEGGADWPGMPDENAPPPRTFRGRVLSYAVPRRPTLNFVSSPRADRENTGCADLGISMSLKPGERWRERVRWSGFSSFRLTPPPAGPYELRARFAQFWRESEGESPDPSLWRDRSIEARVDAWVDNDGPTLLAPAAVVDAALTHQPFSSWLGTQDLGNGRSEWFRYRPDRGVWEVGLLVWYEHPGPRLHYVEVDAVDGALGSGLSDGPWDEELDGWP